MTRKRDRSRYFSTLNLVLSSLSIAFVLILISAFASAADRTGKEVVDAVCISCHGPGKDGAPRIGDKSAWHQRASQGLSNLTQHALNGIRNMPAHGGSPDLSDEEIARAITYMVNQSGGNWVAPVEQKDIGHLRTGEDVVEARCASCHAKGEGGAPMIGDLQAWAPRVQRGIPYLVSSAIHGHGGMPPRGGQANLTDEEIQAAVMYMLNPKSAHPIERPVSEAPDPNHKIAGGMDVYFGFVAAGSIRSLPADAPEQKMHGGVPAEPGYYHINVTLFDHATNAPVEDATLVLDTACPGTATQTVELTPMSFSGAGSYGNYLKPDTSILCKLTLHIDRPGNPGTVTSLDHRFD